MANKIAGPYSLIGRQITAGDGRTILVVDPWGHHDDDPVERSLLFIDLIDFLTQRDKERAEPSGNSGELPQRRSR